MDVVDLRTRRRIRWADRVRSELNRLVYERDEIKAEYVQAAEIYARKLERLNRKAARHAADMNRFTRMVESEAPLHQP